MDSLFDGKYSTYLESSQKPTIEFFCENGRYLFLQKAPSQMSDWVLNTPLYHLLAKVHRMSTNRCTKSFICKIQ